MCAMWSGNTEVTSEETLTHVDRVVVAGATQRCPQCEKFGATVPCKVGILCIYF